MYDVCGMHKQVLALRNMVVVLHFTVGDDSDRHLALALVGVQLHSPGDLGRNRWVLGSSGLKDFGHPRQAADDVGRSRHLFGLTGFQPVQSGLASGFS